MSDRSLSMNQEVGLSPTSDNPPILSGDQALTVAGGCGGGCGLGNGESKPCKLDLTLKEATKIIVRFKAVGDISIVDRGELSLQRGDQVVVQSEYGNALAEVLGGALPLLSNQAFMHAIALSAAFGSTAVGADKQTPHKILRKATSEDHKTRERNQLLEKEAFAFCLDCIKNLQLSMKLISVEFMHSGNRALFNFTSSERVDFRALVKDLARKFKVRIEMRQIGVRDAARCLGGVGSCGTELCCASWLSSFKSISMRMAKDQNLSLNHQKLSGTCGRLRCCLEYEQHIYQEQRKGLPKIGKKILTPQGEGRVKDLDVLRRLVRVELEHGVYVLFNAEVLTPLKNPALLTEEVSVVENLLGEEDAKS